MNAGVIEKAVEKWLADGELDLPVIITGTSSDDRTSPSVRIICQNCLLPEMFPSETKERLASVLIGVVWNADKVNSSDADPSDLAQAKVDAIQDRMHSTKDEVVENSGGFDVLFHGSFLADQVTENEESLLLFTLSYQIPYAYNTHTPQGE